MKALVALLLLAAAAPAQELAAARAAVEAARFEEADALAKALLAKNPKNAAAFVIRAQAAMAANQPERALDHLASALAADRDHADALFYTARLAGILAEQSVGRLAKLDPDSVRLHLLMAEAYKAAGDEEAQRREYEAVLSRDAGNRTAWLGMAEIERGRGKCREALDLFARAAPGSYDVLYGSGACHLVLEELPQAIEKLGRAVALDPESLAARLALGSAHLRNNDAAAALPHLEFVAKAEPREKQSWFLLARAYQRLSRPDDAARAFAAYRKLSDAP